MAEKNNPVRTIKIVVGVAVLALLAVAATRLFVTVPSGHVGVKAIFGKVQEDVLEEGLRFRWPHVDVQKVSVQARSVSVGFAATDPDAAVSKDMQTVGFQVNIGWFVDPGQAWKLVRYVSRRESSWVPNMIDPAMRQGVKAVFSRYTLREIIQNREQVRIEIAQEIGRLIEERLNERQEGLGDSVRITQVTLDNIDYSNEFEQVIEATQREEQRAILAENELRRIEIEAQQQVVQAQAERQASVERARGEAEARLVRLEAEVQGYIALRNAGFDVNGYRFTEVWNGELPQVVSGEGAFDMLIRRGEDGQLDPERVELIMEQLSSARSRIEQRTADQAAAAAADEESEAEEAR